jgi:AraC family transcriptional regulator
MAKLLIKNMVCDRCKTAIKKELDKLRFDYKLVELGEVETHKDLTIEQIEKFKSAIEPLGFELIENRNARVVNQIKKAAIAWARGEDQLNRRMKFSTYLTETMHKDYAMLSNLFSEIESTTIEQYLIHQKIERAKELLVYDELNLGQIADHLNYSSISHLSNQFKKITGLTPMHFKKIGARKRTSIDKV